MVSWACDFGAIRCLYDAVVLVEDDRAIVVAEGCHCKEGVVEVREDMCGSCSWRNGRDWWLSYMRGPHVLLVGYLDMERHIGGMDICESRIGSKVMACATRVNEDGWGGA